MTFYLENTNNIQAHNAVVMAAGDSMYVVQGITIGSSTDWDGVDATSGASIQVQGTIMSLGGNALYLSGGGNHVNVGAGGAIMGNLGAGAAVDAATGHLTLTNAGEISGYYGVNCGSSDNIIHNSGHISGTNNAIHIAWVLNNYIVNSGLIESTEADAILLDSGGNSYERIDNSGTIQATQGHYAINFALGWGEIINTGHIDGDVRLGDMGSIYDGSTGTIDGFVLGGSGDDTILTGVGRDYLLGGGGKDILEGGPGRDTFAFNQVSESTGPGCDRIDDFDCRRDILQVSVDSLLAVDATIANGRLRSDHFNADLVNAVDAAHLAAHHAVLFTPTTGNQKGGVFVVVDANGVAGYQTGADYVIELHNPDNLALFSMQTFGF
jgi:Ca2+-binding RTX toxin-like protein